LCRIEFRVPIHGGDREDTNFIVVGEPECLWFAGHLDRIGKEVGVMIRLIEPIGRVLVGGIPCGVSRLYISWLEADVVFWISRGGRTLLPLL
jgi:hypothetical protein